MERDSYPTGDRGRVEAAPPRPTRRTILGLVGAGMPLIAAACGEASPATPARSSAPVTITYLSNLAETHPEGDARLKNLAEFNATNTMKITVDVAEGKASSNETKVKSLAAAGSPPDIFYTAYYFVAEFLASGMTVDLDTELKGDKEWGKQRADIFPAMLESSMWAGKLAGMPGYTNNQGVIYNTGLLQQAGVAPPKQGWTWNDFKQMAIRFVRPDVIPYSNAWGTYGHYLRTTGGLIISKDAKKMQVDTPEMLQVMEHFLDLLNSRIMQTNPAGTAGLSETYRNAKNDTVFESQGPYRIPTLRQANAPDFGVIHIPVHPQKKAIAASNGGHSMIVFKDVSVERRAAAAQVAKWMNGPQAQAQMCIRATSIPVSKAAMEAKELLEYLKTDAPFKGFVDLAPYGWRWPPLPSWGRIVPAIQTNLDAIMRKEIGIKAGLTKAQQESQLLLDEDVRLMG
jgi:ABC-type glycerol-3-phosphate transport system substrate-binding protein